MLTQQNRDSELSIEASNSSKTSMSSTTTETCSSSSFSRLSFEATAAALCSSSPENLAIKPHRSSSDTAYLSIFRRRSDAENRLSFGDFRLLRCIGAGDIGTVFLCKLRDDVKNEDFYAMKVVDKAALEKKKKVQRAEMEKKILKMLDHPFLPTMYAEFEASHFSCIVMEYCSGGDLHSLRHKQPHKRFSLSSARFYAAEVLVALEYLHMLGIIYRDLKPENVLVRSDGHIMLSDFDLSLCSDSIPAVESPLSSSLSSPEPACPHSNRYTRTHLNKPEDRPPCFPTYRLLFRSRKIQTVQLNRLFVAEPVNARSNSFVGTHEYVSPEVASGGDHGNAVDWWAFGIFLYEMIYGRTPFAGPSNEVVLRNIVKKPVCFPSDAPCSVMEYHARDLITGLLNKDPGSRVGSKRGSADVKKHPFFKGLNFALIRTVTPPEIPGLRRHKTMPLGKSGSHSTAPFDFF